MASSTACYVNSKSTGTLGRWSHATCVLVQVKCHFRTPLHVAKLPAGFLGPHPKLSAHLEHTWHTTSARYQGAFSCRDEKCFAYYSVFDRSVCVLATCSAMWRAARVCQARAWVMDAGVGGGGGQWGQLAPTTSKLWGRPPALDCKCCSFLFLFVLFFQGNLGLSQKIVGQMRGVFSFG